MKEIITPPGARRLITSLRDMGYSFSGAIADLVDHQLGKLVGERLEEGHHLARQCFRHLFPRVFWIVLQDVKKDGVAFDPH